LRVRTTLRRAIEGIRLLVVLRGHDRPAVAPGGSPETQNIGMISSFLGPPAAAVSRIEVGSVARSLKAIRQTVRVDLRKQKHAESMERRLNVPDLNRIIVGAAQQT
jgi:hypothetical protein